MGLRCVKCEADNNLTGNTKLGNCKRCNHPFVFEPITVTDKKLAFTDKFFKKAIEDISSQNMLFFSPKQFLYFIDKRLRKKSALLNPLVWLFPYFLISLCGVAFFFFFGGIISLIPILKDLGVSFFTLLIFYNIFWVLRLFQDSKSPKNSVIERRNNATNLKILGVIILVIGIIISLIANYFPGYIAATALGLFSYWLGISQKKNLHNFSEKIIVFSQEFIVNQAQIDKWLRDWQRVNGALEKLLPAPRQEALPASIDPEVSAYSFDRAIICDSDEIAQFLIANNVHFENNCAILSISGYPQSIFDTVIEMLRRNADLKVYALHDANPAGVSLVHQLRTSPNWFANQAVTIFDLGISPRQILETRDMFVQQSQTMAQSARQLPDAVRQGLTAEELAWLDAGNFVELESFTPQRLLRVVNYGLAQSGDPQSNDGLILAGGAAYGGGYVFVSDSFG